jgi:hypothetical protein
VAVDLGENLLELGPVAAQRAKTMKLDWAGNNAID